LKRAFLEVRRLPNWGRRASEEEKTPNMDLGKSNGRAKGRKSLLELKEEHVRKHQDPFGIRAMTRHRNRYVATCKGRGNLKGKSETTEI